MTEYRFILEEMYRQIRRPIPFGLFNPEVPAGVEPSMDSIENLTDDQLAELLVTNAKGVPMVFPLYLAVEGGPWWLLPYEPQVTIQGSNVLVKKQVSKGAVRGTIKERWSQGDYRISISGILMGEGNKYPSDDVKQLRSFCEAGKVLVKSPQMELFSINQIVVEDWALPFTAGQANQAYTITAVSDDIYKLLLRSEDLKQI
jgi:hypothetical protein